MTDSQMQQHKSYQADHKNMGQGLVRRIGVLYHFWDKDGNEKSIVNADDLSHITLLEERVPARPLSKAFRSAANHIYSGRGRMLSASEPLLEAELLLSKLLLGSLAGC